MAQEVIIHGTPESVESSSLFLLESGVRYDLLVASSRQANNETFYLLNMQTIFCYSCSFLFIFFVAEEGRLGISETVMQSLPHARGEDEGCGVMKTLDRT